MKRLHRIDGNRFYFFKRLEKRNETCYNFDYEKVLSI